MRVRSSFRLFTASAITLVCASGAIAQPSLLPPGPPIGPSGRMGVRTEIKSIPYIITSPGSYYLSGNLTQTIPGSPGITVAASRVTIDLMGFSLTGMGMPDTGITFAPGAPIRDVTIHDGFVSGWGGSGINTSLIPDAHVWNVTADGNGSTGIWVGPVSIVRDVVAADNGGAGVRADFGCTITNTVTYYNAAEGINAASECRVSDSTAVSNTGNGISLGDHCVLIGSTADGNGQNGVLAANSCRMTNCAASYNGVFGYGDGFDASGDSNMLSGCTADYNTSNGFETISGTSRGASAEECVASYNGFGAFGGDGFVAFKNVMNCRANNNANDGILVFYGAHVYRNTCESNNQNGIEAGSNGTVIEQNFVVHNVGVGIKTIAAAGLGSMVASNRATQNSGGNYSFGPGDTTGPIITGPIILSSPAAAMANISF